LIRGAAGEAHQAKHAGKVGFEGAWGVVAASERTTTIPLKES